MAAPTTQTNTATNSLPLPNAAGSIPPSMSTRSMSPDRGLLGKIVGHLYIAAKILIEGRARPIEELRHEIRVLMSGTGTAAAAGPANSGSATPAGNISLSSWQTQVAGMLRSTGGLPTTISSLPDDIKRELAGLIKQGKALGSGSADAVAQVSKASDKYLKLSGVSYL